MPNERFDGVLAGGITFQEIQTERTKQKLRIKAYRLRMNTPIIALLMQQTLNEVAPNLTLHEVKPDQINARNVILANVQNDQNLYQSSSY